MLNYLYILSLDSSLGFFLEHSSTVLRKLSGAGILDQGEITYDPE